MTELDMKKLQPGDVIRGKNSADGYIVTANYGNRVTAVRTTDMTNPSEWDLVVKANPERLKSPGWRG